MNVVKRIKGFKVESHTPGKFYDVNIKEKFCSCPHYKFRLAKQGEDCKHIRAVKEWISERARKKGKGILEFVKEQKEVDSLELIQKYGQSIVNDLIGNGELLEEGGKIRLM